MKTNQNLFLAGLAFFFFTIGGAAASDSTAGVDFTGRFSDQVLEFTPGAGLHFNEKAPSKVTFNGKNLTLHKSPTQVTARAPGLKEGGAVTAALYLCDNGNTFCIKKEKKLTFEELKMEKKIVVFYGFRRD